MQSRLKFLANFGQANEVHGVLRLRICFAGAKQTPRSGWQTV